MGPGSHSGDRARCKHCHHTMSTLMETQQLTLEHLMALARHGNLPGRMHPHPNCTKNAPKYPTSKKANFKGKKAGPAGNGVGRSRAWTTTRGILLMNRHGRAARKYTKVVTSQPTYPPTRHVPTPQKWGRIKGLCAFWTIGFPSRGCTTRGEIERWEGSFFLAKKDVDLKPYLGGGFKYFLFSPLVGEDSHFD